MTGFGTNWLIRNVLSDEDFYLVGAYVQTCAHIEEYMWEYYCLENSASEKDVEIHVDMIALRRNTPDLVKAIKRHTQSVTDTEERSMLDFMIVGYELGKDMRDSTVHGAMVHVGDGNYVNVRHWLPADLPKADAKKQAFVFKQAFDRTHLVTALDNADAMLTTAKELYHRAARRVEEARKSARAEIN